MLKRIALAATFLLPTLSAQAETAQEAAAKIAKQRKYTPEQARCYAEVFPQFAAQDGAGEWQGPTRGRAASVYKDTLQSKCGISR